MRKKVKLPGRNCKAVFSHASIFRKAIFVDRTRPATGNTMSTVAWEVLKSGTNKVSVLVMAIDYG